MNDPVNFLDPDGMDYTPASNFAWNSFILNMPFSSGVSRIPYVVGPGAGVISNPCPGVKSTGLDILNYLASKGGNSDKENQTAEEIIYKGKKGNILREFPSELLKKTFNEIMKMAKQGVRSAIKAKKLLTDRRFNK